MAGVSEIRVEPRNILRALWAEQKALVHNTTAVPALLNPLPTVLL
jgi:hypothetical protein